MNKELRWCIDESKSIIGISKIQNKGLVFAKETFKQLSNSNFNLEAQEFKSLLNEMELNGIIIIVKEDVEQNERLIRQNKEKEAYAWLNTLSEKEKEMVRTLMSCMIPTAG